jgi:hypothetical protein
VGPASAKRFGRAKQDAASKRHHYRNTNFVRNGSWTMMTILTILTEKEYKETMIDKMVDVTSTAEPIVDIWPYVQQLTRDNEVSNYVYENQLVEMVSRNGKGTFDHVLIPTDKSNVFVVIIVDLKNKAIKGHFKLDINKEYGLE